ncbi:putative metalloprotease HI0409 [Proteiniborus sp. DW1]|uniref:M23 family metallopeptidase n=1 Tax=Proteiniborus sp. DW1 TaxID=1889883 RepID=UPI00092E1066|nr:M23 family metallopeptidase [Proteiniborus sp. DW1]SCG83102.1 putative metalloprotease HI0409 [Proteiniborus sp. DW1]
MKTVHIKNKKAQTFSLLIIPHSKQVSQVNIATWVPKFLAALVATLLFISGYLCFKLYTSYNILKQEYSEKTNKLNALEEINQQQEQEIAKLRNISAEVQEKLETIDNLQGIVKSLVGLEDFSEKEEDPEQNISRLPSRGGPSLKTDFLLDSSKNDIEIQIKELSSLLDKSHQDLNSLIEDVEVKLKYLDAKPNLMPTTGRVTSGFGYRKNPFGRGREFHNGIDIANSSGTEIKAAGSGIVTFAGYNGGYGRYIIISHGYGYQSVYGHNRKLLVKVGDKVEKGQTISEMGNSGRSTGPHLHFEVRLNGNPIDPMKVIDNLD